MQAEAQAAQAVGLNFTQVQQLAALRDAAQNQGGMAGTVSAQLDLELPSGSQAAATVVKYLVSSGFGSSGTVTAGAEAASRFDWWQNGW